LVYPVSGVKRGLFPEHRMVMLLPCLKEFLLLTEPSNIPLKKILEPFNRKFSKE
jgi:hypothetical protein